MILSMGAVALLAFILVHVLLRLSVHTKDSMTAQLRAIPVNVRTEAVAIGVTSSRVFRAGHVSLLLRFEDGTLTLVHKEPNGRISNFRAVWNMIRYGHHARIELIRFEDQDQFESFQNAFQWRFSPVFLQNPHAVSEYVQSLVDARGLAKPIFCFVGRNCVDFVADLLKVGNSTVLPYHPIPFYFFDKLESLGKSS